MEAIVFNRIGLVLGIVGVALIFKWGPPQPSFEEAILLATEGAGGDARAAETRRLKRRHELLSRIGLGLVGLGFAAQFAGTYA
jgi:hypothetical protein